MSCIAVTSNLIKQKWRTNVVHLAVTYGEVANRVLARHTIWNRLFVR